MNLNRRLLYGILSWTIAINGVSQYALQKSLRAAAGNYYFSSSTGNNANSPTCSSGAPCHDLKGTTLDNTGAVDCGSTINLRRGDVWEGSEAEFELKSQGCAGNPIIIQAWPGTTGADPILAGAPVTSTGWSLSSSKTSVTTDNTTDLITQTSHGLATGDEVYFTATGSMPTGISSATKYYARYVSGNTYQIHTTHAGAQGNTSRVTWTTNGSGVQSYTPTYVQAAAQTQTHLKTVAYTISGTHGGLGYWSGSTTQLQRGTFKRSSNTLYVRMPNDEDPATSNVRIGNFSHSSGDGSHGLLRGAEDENHSSYQWYRDITILGPNGVGFSFNGTGNRSANIKVFGAGQDGFLCWHLGFLGACTDGVNYYDEYAFNAAGANGAGGSGQGWTTWGGPYMWAVGYADDPTPFSHDNFMAGIDFLDFNSSTNVTESGTMRLRIKNNGRNRSDPSYDSGLYDDGASEVFHYGTVVSGSGTGEGRAYNARAGIAFASEHPTTKPAENLYDINSLVFGNHWVTTDSGEICYSSTTECPPDGNTKPNNNYNHVHANGTYLSYDAGTFDMVYSFGSIDPTAHNLKYKNNIVIADSAYVYAYGVGSTFTTSMEADYNHYYRRGGSTNLWASNGGGSPFYTLSQWQSTTGEDANSTNSDPLLTNNGDSPDPTLQDGSPAINTGTTTPYTIPAWLPATIAYDIGPQGLRGSTRPSGAIDDVASNMDKGYHKDYAGLRNVVVTPVSYTQNTVTTYTIQFQMPEKITALLLNWKVKFTFPSGYTLSSGASSVFASSNISGTWTTGISGQSVTGTRVGDGNSEFPGTYSFTVTNVKNPNTVGTTGTFLIETQDDTGIKVAEYYDGSTSTTYNQVPGISITSGSSSVCGNSIIESGETCDDGNTNNFDGCSSTCQTETPVCGNSIVEYLEQCDDGNTNNFDGCSSTCQTENPVCGNGIVEYLEQCDDSNTNNGDGCSSTCQTEVVTPNNRSVSGPVTISGPCSRS